MNAWENEFVAAVEAKNESRAIEIICSGFPVNFQMRPRDFKGFLLQGHTYPLLLAIELELYSLAHVLLKSGASSNVCDRMGQTGILISSRLGNLDLIQLLLKFKASISARDFAGNTMLHISTLNGKIEVIKYCIEKLKFPIILQNRKGHSALDIARAAQETCKSLEEIERNQMIFEYLWRVQEKFYRERRRNDEQHTTFVKRMPRFALDGLAKISVLPESSGSTTPQAARHLEKYLVLKHNTTYKACSAKGFNMERIGRIYRIKRNANSTKSLSPFC